MSIEEQCVPAEQLTREGTLGVESGKSGGAWRAAVVGAALAASLLGAGVGVYYGLLAPSERAGAAAAEAALREQEEQNRKLQQDQERLQQKIADAERQIFEEKKKKALAMATAEPTSSASAPRSGPTIKPKTACKPCVDRASPFCDLNGCEMSR